MSSPSGGVALYCPRCGAALANGAAFCSRCGQAIAQIRTSEGPASATPSGGPAPAASIAGAKRAKKWAVVGTGAVIGILALLFCLWQSGLLAGRSELPAPVLMKREQAAPPALGKVGLAMPDDISNWLKHLERIENEKHALLDKEIANMKVFEQMIGAVGAGINEVDPYDQDSDPNSGNPGSITKGKFEDLRPEWAKLLTDFESVPPPAECQQIANNYQTGLEAVPNMIGEVNNVLNQVGTDPSMALKNMQEMQNKSYGEVDKPFANADQEVQDICDKYQTAKWFKIGDVGGNFFGGF